MFALCIVHDLVRRGPATQEALRTSIYSNFVPIVAMLAAVTVLHEPLGLREILGAAAVLGRRWPYTPERLEIGRSAAGIAPTGTVRGPSGAIEQALETAPLFAARRRAQGRALGEVSFLEELLRDFHRQSPPGIPGDRVPAVWDPWRLHVRG